MPKKVDINITTNKKENEKKSSFLMAIPKAFDSFVSAFKKHGLIYSLFVMIMFMFLYSCIIHPVNIDRIVTDVMNREQQIKQRQKEESIEQRIEADKLIHQIMNDVMDNFNVNRCLLFEIHNGSTNLSNVEYLFYSATNELINTNNTQGEDAYNLEYQSDSFQNQHIANFLGQITYNRLKKEPYLYFSHLEEYHRTSYRFINKMKNIGAESVIIVPFLSHNIPVVLLVFSSKDPEMDAPAIYRYVEKFRPQIEKNLMNINQRID